MNLFFLFILNYIFRLSWSFFSHFLQASHFSPLGRVTLFFILHTAFLSSENFFHEKFHLFLRIFTRLFHTERTSSLHPARSQLVIFSTRHKRTNDVPHISLGGRGWAECDCTKVVLRLVVGETKKINRGKKSAKIINFISRTRHCAFNFVLFHSCNSHFFIYFRYQSRLSSHKLFHFFTIFPFSDFSYCSTERTYYSRISWWFSHGKNVAHFRTLVHDVHSKTKLVSRVRNPTRNIFFCFRRDGRCSMLVCDVWPNTFSQPRLAAAIFHCWYAPVCLSCASRIVTTVAAVLLCVVTQNSTSSRRKLVV